MVAVCEIKKVTVCKDNSWELDIHYVIKNKGIHTYFNEMNFFFISIISPGSVVGSHRNFGVESKIELNYLEGLLLRKKKTWVDIPERLQFSGCYETLVNEKSTIQKKECIIYHWLVNLM